MWASRGDLTRLRGVARRLVWGAVVCIALPILAWLAAALYENSVAPTDGYLPGLLTAALVLYLAPVGLVLLVLGSLASVLAWWLGRDRASLDASTQGASDLGASDLGSNESHIPE